MTPTKKYRLSPTGLGLYRDCPRCFWLHHVVKLRRPQGPFPSLPNGMDLVIKKYADGFRRIGGVPPELALAVDEHTKLFSGIRKLRLWRSNFVGIEWRTPEGHVLRGAIDDLLVRKGKLIPLDYKTRMGPPKPDTAGYYVDQLSCYALLFEKNGFSVENYGLLQFWWPLELNAPEEVWFSTEVVRVPVDTRRAESLFTDAIALLEGPIPPYDGKCLWCKRIKDGEALAMLL